MRKSTLFLGVLFAGATLFTSCTKDLKNDIKDLKKQTEELKKHNDHLQGQVDSVKLVLGTNEPLAVTTTFKDDNNVTRTVSGTYTFKSTGSSTHNMTRNTDGTYDIELERYSDMWGEEGVDLEFTYNPTTKAVTNKYVYHYWDDYDDYSDYAQYWEGYSNPAPTINITVEKLDVNTGEFSVKVTASGNADYTYNYGGPNEGKEVSTTFSFTGKLQLMKTGR